MCCENSEFAQKKLENTLFKYYLKTECFILKIHQKSQQSKNTLLRFDEFLI